jgi:RNA polymerase subunit RPABC4/transcription elongation factor Spt4
MCGEIEKSSGKWHGKVVIVTPDLIQFANMD